MENLIVKKKKNRTGVFIGAYVPAEIKEALIRRAALENTTVSKVVTDILRKVTKKDK